MLPATRVAVAMHKRPWPERRQADEKGHSQARPRDCLSRARAVRVVADPVLKLFGPFAQMPPVRRCILAPRVDCNARYYKVGSHRASSPSQRPPRPPQSAPIARFEHRVLLSESVGRLATQRHLGKWVSHRTPASGGGCPHRQADPELKSFRACSDLSELSGIVVSNSCEFGKSFTN